MIMDEHETLHEHEVAVWGQLTASATVYCCTYAAALGRSHSYPCLAMHSASPSPGPVGLGKLAGEIVIRVTCYVLDCISRCFDIWKVRMGVLVARGGVSEGISI